MNKGILAWISNLGIFAGLATIAFFPKTKLAAGFSYFGYVVLIVSCTLYYILVFTSKLLIYLQNKVSITRVYEFVQQLCANPPSITMDIVCSHPEYRGKHLDREITYTAAAQVEYKTWKDNSNPFALSMRGVRKKGLNACIMLKIGITLEHAKDGTGLDIDSLRDKFITENSKDMNQDYTERVNVDGYKKHCLVLLAENEPRFFSTTAYYVFSLLPFHVIYRMYFFSRCTVQRFNVKKLVSTRSDLSLNRMFPLRSCGVIEGADDFRRPTRRFNVSILDETNI